MELSGREAMHALGAPRDRGEVSVYGSKTSGDVLAKDLPAFGSPPEVDDSPTTSRGENCDFSERPLFLRGKSDNFARTWQFSNTCSYVFDPRRSV